MISFPAQEGRKEPGLLRPANQGDYIMRIDQHVDNALNQSDVTVVHILILWFCSFIVHICKGGVCVPGGWGGGQILLSQDVEHTTRLYLTGPDHTLTP